MSGSEMKLIWILFILAGISLWYIPNTLSLFSGQHSFYNIDPMGSQIDCIKCHGDIGMALHSGNIHNNFSCSDCHRVQKGVQYASGDDAYDRLVYINVTGPTSIQFRVLATTLQNYQQGNFPNSISGEIMIDQWAAAGNDDVQLRDQNGQYAGNMTAGETGILYNYANITEVPTDENGLPKDKDITTRYSGLDTRKINVNSDPYGEDNLTGAGSRVVTPGTSAHAASIVMCTDCHSEYINNTPDTIHESFIKYGIEYDSNDNCIACHTSVAVSIVWTRPSTIAFETSSDGHNISINRTYQTNSVQIETFGNQSGEVFAITNETLI